MQLDNSTALTLPPAAFVPLLVVTLGFLIYCWVDIARYPVKYLPKLIWAAICMISLPLGGIVYLIVGRDEVHES
jgi:uncharacterized membrane protein YczE